MKNVGGTSKEELIRIDWVMFALKEMDRITKLVDLGGATEYSDQVYSDLMKRLGVSQ
jgi:hypothetical protein